MDNEIMGKRSPQPQQQIQPGQCPPQGCPPPDRIECIIVDKVYDSCFQIEERTRDITLEEDWDISVGDLVDCELDDDITCQEVDRVPVGDGFFTLTILVTVPLTLTNPENTEQTFDTNITFTKTVTLCAPEGVEVDCTESTLTQCNCVVTGEGVITCEIQVCVVIKTVLTVQLLVPSYGFCVPAPCVTLPGVCPPLPPEQCF